MHFIKFTLKYNNVTLTINFISSLPIDYKTCHDDAHVYSMCVLLGTGVMVLGGSNVLVPLIHFKYGGQNIRTIFLTAST